MLESLNILKISNCSVQYRFNTIQSSGMIFQIRTQIDFSISNSNILGCALQTNINNVVFVNKVLSSIQLTINIQNIKVCTNIIYDVGIDYQSQILFSDKLIVQCQNICIYSEKYVYGLCKPDLINGDYNSNGTISCQTPFLFNDSQCICPDGYLINESMCVNVVKQLTSINVQLKNQIDNTYSVLNQLTINGNEIQSNSTLIKSINKQLQNLIDDLQVRMNAIQSSVSGSTVSCGGGTNIRLCAGGLCGYLIQGLGNCPR
ncbi:Hypothetical_protein [Hexamita inflata]|uniref:Hypothetical_protein n=1 Tax=Hexamita inflata TaxID=28002 RepID=A0AA86TVS1_9EUKA|nr:Hypothetical protein HINF_LOCUS17926 [Hexamita inflata]